MSRPLLILKRCHLVSLVQWGASRAAGMAGALSRGADQV